MFDERVEKMNVKNAMILTGFLVGVFIANYLVQKIIWPALDGSHVEYFCTPSGIEYIKTSKGGLELSLDRDSAPVMCGDEEEI